MKPARRIEPTEWMRADATRAVVDALTADGQEIRFVGGSVRDALLGGGNTTAHRDIDIATPRTPHQVIALLDNAGIKNIPTGLAHGTVTAVVDGRHFEITTLRIDVETHGRHADVAFTDDWQEDAARRDFTMNALTCTPEGELYDPWDGVKDLKAGRVRFVGDAAQPLHTTKHFNGWVGENPNGYTTSRRFHSKIDGGFFKATTAPKAATLQKRLRPAALVKRPAARVDASGQFQAALNFILAQHRLVEPLYQLEKEKKLSVETPAAGRAFMEGQLLKGSQMLGDLWFTAWKEAPPDRFLQSYLAQRKLRKK